jgi:predicted dehydrogenase
MTTEKIWRWGVWGSGRMAQNWVNDFFLCENVVLSAIGSRSFMSAQKLASGYTKLQGSDFPVKAFSSLEEMCTSSEIDIIYIATPNHLHARNAITALNSGKHVLLEKPFCISYSEAKDICAAAKANQKFCMEAMWMRFIPMIQALKKILLQNTFGEATFLRAEFGLNLSPTTHARQFVSLEQGGGAAFDLGVYVMSFAHYLFGETEDFYRVSSKEKNDCDLSTVFICRHKEDKISELSCSLVHEFKNSAYVYTTTHEIEITSPFYKTMQIRVREKLPHSQIKKGFLKKLEHFFKKGMRKFFDFPVKRFHGPFPGNGYQFQIAHVVDCLNQGLLESPVMPLSESIRMIKEIEEKNDRKN